MYILYHYLDLLGKILVGRLKAKFGEFFPWMAGGGGVRRDVGAVGCMTVDFIAALELFRML